MDENLFPSRVFITSQTQRNGIYCSKIPNELNHKNVLEQHFKRFGQIVELQHFEASNAVAVFYSENEEAEFAKNNSLELDGYTLKVQFYQSKTLHTSSRDNSPSPYRNRKMINEHSGKNNFGFLNTECKTNMERLNLLEKVDHAMRDDQIINCDVTRAKKIIGTCVDICPEKERYLRMERNLCSIYEMDKNKVAHHDMMIKEYSRSSADRKEELPSQLRSSQTLKDTMDYMLSTVLENIDYEKISDWYDFTWNRTRAIRKDISIQQLNDENAIDVVEQCARFHICCAHELCEEENRTFDPKINNENLEKTMKTLLDMYKDCKDNNSGVQLINEAEFRSYHILLNFNKTTDVLTELISMDDSVKSTDDVKMAKQAFVSFREGNYVRFFKCVKSCTYLQGALLHRYFNQVRMGALITMRSSFLVERGTGRIRLPKQKIIDLLCFNNSIELDNFAAFNGILIEENTVILDRNVTYGNEESTMTSQKSWLIQEKMLDKNLSQIISKSEEEIEFENIPTSSFDEVTGRYIGSFDISKTRQTPTQENPTERISPRSNEDIFNRRDIVKNLEDRGIPNKTVKSIVIDFINETIADLLLEICNEEQNGRLSELVAEKFRENFIIEECRYIAVDEINIEIKRVKTEQENRQREIELRNKMEARKRKMEAERKRLIELEEKRKRDRELLINEVLQEFIDAEVENIATEIALEVHNKEMIKVASEEINKNMFEQVIAEETSVIAHQIYKEERNNHFLLLTDKFYTLKKRNLFCKWQNSLKQICERRKINQNFPSRQGYYKNSFSERIVHITGGKSKYQSESYSSRLKRRKMMSENITSLQSNMQEAHDDALNNIIDLLQVVKGSCNLDDTSQQMIWKLTIAVYGSDEQYSNWINKKLNLDENGVFYGSKENIKVVCNMIQPKSNHQTYAATFATSAFLIINYSPQKTLQKIIDELNISDEKPVCYLNKQAGSGKRKLMRESVIVEDVIKNSVQLHRDLSWLVANSITEDYLVGVKARTYYEEALMNNFFIPISECLNENQETFSFNELVTAYNHVVQMATEILTSVEDVDTWPSNEFERLSHYSLNSGQRWNDSQRINEINKLSTQLMLPDSLCDQDSEKSLVEFVRNYIKNLKLLEEDVLLEYQTDKMLMNFQDDYYLDNQLDCKQFPWMNFVETVSNSLLVHNLYCENGDLPVYYMENSENEICLPQEIQQKINYVISESNKKSLNKQKNQEETNLENFTEKEEFDDERSTEILDRSCRDCSLVDIDLFEETFNCSANLNDKISNELEQSIRFEKYLEQVLMDG